MWFGVFVALHERCRRRKQAGCQGERSGCGINDRFAEDREPAAFFSIGIPRIRGCGCVGVLRVRASYRL